MGGLRLTMDDLSTQGLDFLGSDMDSLAEQEPVNESIFDEFDPAFLLKEPLMEDTNLSSQHEHQRLLMMTDFNKSTSSEDAFGTFGLLADDDMTAVANNNNNNNNNDGSVNTIMGQAQQPPTVIPITPTTTDSSGASSPYGLATPQDYYDRVTVNNVSRNNSMTHSMNSHCNSNNNNNNNHNMSSSSLMQGLPTQGLPMLDPPPYGVVMGNGMTPSRRSSPPPPPPPTILTSTGGCYSLPINSVVVNNISVSSPPPYTASNGPPSPCSLGMSVSAAAGGGGGLHSMMTPGFDRNTTPMMMPDMMSVHSMPNPSSIPHNSSSNLSINNNNTSATNNDMRSVSSYEMMSTSRSQPSPRTTVGGAGGGPGQEIKSFNEAMEKLCESMKRSAMSRNLVKQLSGRSLVVKQGSSSTRALPTRQGSLRTLTTKQGSGRFSLTKELSNHSLHTQLSSRSLHKQLSGRNIVDPAGRVTPTTVVNGNVGVGGGSSSCTTPGNTNTIGNGGNGNGGNGNIGVVGVVTPAVPLRRLSIDMKHRMGTSPGRGIYRQKSSGSLTAGRRATQQILQIDDNTMGIFYDVSDTVHA